jgi:hypothetical protein
MGGSNPNNYYFQLTITRKLFRYGGLQEEAAGLHWRREAAGQRLRLLQSLDCNVVFVSQNVVIIFITMGQKGVAFVKIYFDTNCFKFDFVLIKKATNVKI